MGSSECPSPYRVAIYYEQEVKDALALDPDVTLQDFLSDWSEKNNCAHAYMSRTEQVDYWLCTECHRVYEVQAKAQGRWLRIFIPSETSQDSLDLSCRKRIYVFRDVETDAATEKKIDLRLEDYLKQHQNPAYYLSEDETSASVMDSLTNHVLAEYTLEDSWDSIIK